MQQSPIVLDDTIHRAANKPVITIPTVEDAELENLGTTLEVAINGTTVFRGAEYTLRQFHFHSPSEHRIYEEYYPLEMHMVHQAASPVSQASVDCLLTRPGLYRPMNRSP